MTSPRVSEQLVLPRKLLYTPEEAAVLLSMSRTRVYALLARKVIGSFKEGRARLIPSKALDAFINRRLREQLQAAQGSHISTEGARPLWASVDTAKGPSTEKKTAPGAQP